MVMFSAAERTVTFTASYYCGELLGGPVMALFLKAASSLLANGIHPAVIACDNMGVVIHGNNRYQSPQETQSQADVIRCFCKILVGLPFRITYKHVYGHQDNRVVWDDLTLFQQLNVITDRLAQEALW